ncbi:MAG: hypothetical protein SF029_14375, partial [bacterium]|nr:hypothetical protein [bacterium]
GDDNGDPVDWGAQPGAYTMDTIPYSDNYGRGTAGSRYVVSFTFVRQTAAATVTPRPTIAPTNTRIPPTFAPPTSTPRPIVVPPTATPVPPTATTRPTNTPVPPTATTRPTNTPVPPTATPIPPTNTPVPPTATAVPPTNTPVPPTATTVPPTNTPAPTALPVTGHSIIHFILVDGDTDQDIRVMTNGETVNLATLPTRNINIRVVTNPTTVGSIKFILNGAQFSNANRVENTAPYALWGDENGDYYGWQPRLGSYTLLAQSFELRDLAGSAGRPMTVQFNVVDARPVEFALDVNVVGSGTVQMNPARTTFEAGTTVQMVAVPEAGWQFAGWSGAISSADVAATVTVTNNLDVVANFVQAQTPPTSFPPTVAAPTTTPVTPTVVAPTVVAPTATPIPATLPLALSMDDGQSTNWTLNGSWSMTTISAYGGTGSAWMATPATQYGMLAYALPIDLRTAIRPELTFQSRLSATQHSPALEISTNTRDWTLVVSPQPSADWTEYTLDLTVYTGQMIWLRWTWTPLSATALQSTDTWMIDQVTVAEFVPDPIVPSATPLPTIAPSTTPLPTIALSATPLPTIEVPPTATPLPATPVPTTPPTAIPVVLQPLTLTSVCAGTWQIDNLNAVPLNVQWEVAGTGLRTPLTANPGATPLVTGAPAGQPESITLIFDLGDGLGERSVTQASNMAACP